MQTLGQAIKARNQAGYLGLIPCVIPGFPDIERSLEINQLLDNSEAVTALEFTLPAAESFSDSANQTIIGANQQAVQRLAGLDLKMWLETSTANFIMIYREAVKKVGFEPLVAQFTETCCGIALEWEEKELLPYKEVCDRAGIELVIAVHPEMTETEIDFFSQFILPDGLVYMLCSPEAGGERYTPTQLETFAQAIKTRLPNTVIVASQGIYTPADVRQMAAIPSIDAAVIGTAFFQAAEKGTSTVQTYLNSLEPELLRAVS